MEIIYDEKLCVRCGACATECECGGIYFERGKIVIDKNRAEDWASIAEICPTGALTLSNEKSAPWTGRGPSQVAGCDFCGPLSLPAFLSRKKC